MTEKYKLTTDDILLLLSKGRIIQCGNDRYKINVAGNISQCSVDLPIWSTGFATFKDLVYSILNNKCILCKGTENEKYGKYDK